MDNTRLFRITGPTWKYAYYEHNEGKTCARNFNVWRKLVNKIKGLPVVYASAFYPDPPPYTNAKDTYAAKGCCFGEKDKNRQRRRTGGQDLVYNESSLYAWVAK